MRLSERGSAAPASPIRKLVPLADQAKAKGIKVFHLNIGQPDIPTPPVMWEALRRAEIEVLSYSPSGGIAPFREALVRYYGRYDLEVSYLDASEQVVASETIEGVEVVAGDWSIYSRRIF